MAKTELVLLDKEGEKLDLSEHPLLIPVLQQVAKLWSRGNKKFMDAMDDSQRKQIQLNFAAILNTKENAPVVDVTLSFKDKCKESGMDVIKTFRISETEELEDPTQPGLPGTEGARGGKIASGDGDASNGEAEAEGGKKKRGRPRKDANPIPE